jgi:hypothetical protein
VCGLCSTNVLAEAVGEGDLWDLAFKCFECGGLSIGPLLPRGRPLPWRSTVLIPPGNYMIKGTVAGKGQVVMVGQEGLDRALKEVGTTFAVEVAGSSSELNAATLDGLVSRTKALLGDTYEILAAKHGRGLRASTPPKRPHRLMELVTAAEAASTSFAAGHPTVDPVAIIELHLTIGQLERWRNHPTWPSLLPSLKTPDEFPHLVVTLAAASFLTDAENGVELVPVGGTRSPDLRLHLGARNAVAAEVKAPRELQRPPTPLTAETTFKIVGDALAKAGSSTGGQLAPGSDAFPIVGGFSLRDADLDVLEEAARRVLQQYPAQRRHVMGISIVSLGTLIESRPAGVGRTLPVLSGTITPRTILNPNYTGPNTVSPEEHRGSSAFGTRMTSS